MSAPIIAIIADSGECSKGFLSHPGMFSSIWLFVLLACSKQRTRAVHDLPFFHLRHPLPILVEKLLEPLVWVKTISVLGGILNRKYDVREIGGWQTFNRLLLACVCLGIAQNLPDSPGYLCPWPFSNELSEDSSSVESAVAFPCPFNKGFVGCSQAVFQQPSFICNFQLKRVDTFRHRCQYIHSYY